MNLSGLGVDEFLGNYQEISGYDEDAERVSAYYHGIYNPNFMRDYPCSHLPEVALDPENMVSFEEILEKGPNQIHIGKFLVGHLIGTHSPTEFTLGLILEDNLRKFTMNVFFVNPGIILEKGEPVKFDLSTFKPDLGSILAIMNPFFSEKRRIDCRNLRHIVVIGAKNHQIFENCDLKFKPPFCFEDTGLEATEAGVKFFRLKNYPMAVECFSKSIENRSPDLVRVFGNRAMTYLCLGKPNLALEDAEKGLKIDPKSSKLIYRKALSLMKLARFEECAEFLMRKEADLIENELTCLLERAKGACVEAQVGKYDFEYMASDAPLMEVPIFEGYPDFFEKRVEFSVVPGFGRALVAKETIPAGTLILGSKALAFWEKSKAYMCRLCQTGEHSGHGGVIDAEPWHQIASICAAKFSSDPGLFERFKNLFESPLKQLKKSVFQDSDSESSSDDSETEQEDPFTKLVKVRDFIAETVKANILYSEDPISKRNFCGVWFFPLFIKHTCIDANCIRQTFGDLLFIRTIKAVEKGDQLTCSLACSALDAFKIRKTSLEDRREFHCECRLCKLDRLEVRKGIDSNLDALRNDFFNPENAKNPEKLKSLQEKALSLRPDPVLNILALQIQARRAVLLKETGNFEAAISLMKESIQRFEEISLPDEAGSLCAIICSWPLDPEKLAPWKEKSIALGKLVYGDISPENFDISELI